MQEFKSNMYVGWKTWNPLAGVCPHKCSYCSTKSFMRYPVIKCKYSGELRLDEKAMNKDLGENNKWFVVAQNDLFAKEVPDKIIQDVISRCWEYCDNTYLFQTKNPQRFINWREELRLPDVVLCTTIESNRFYPSMGVAPSPHHRALAMSGIEGFTKQVTIEPIHDFDLGELVQLIRMSRATQVAIGGDSKRNHLPEPSREKLLSLIGELKQFTTIDQKRNLDRLLK